MVRSIVPDRQIHVRAVALQVMAARIVAVVPAEAVTAAVAAVQVEAVTVAEALLVEVAMAAVMAAAGITRVVATVEANDDRGTKCACNICES